MKYSKEFEDWFNAKYPRETVELIGVADAIKDIAYAAWKKSEDIVFGKMEQTTFENEHCLHYDGW